MFVECLSDFVRLAVEIGAAHLMWRRLAPVESWVSMAQWGAEFLLVLIWGICVGYRVVTLFVLNIEVIYYISTSNYYCLI